MTKKQFAVVKPFDGEIVGLIWADDAEQFAGDGRVYRALSEPLAAFPEAPFAAAVWSWGEQGPYWHDPRTDEQRAADARAERDRLLAATDWVVIRAFETGALVPAPWLAYRAALRDLTDQADFPDSITWPTSPSA